MSVSIELTVITDGLTKKSKERECQERESVKVKNKYIHIYINRELQ